MWYVYIIRSVDNPAQRYIGLAEHPEERLKSHNRGESPHTSKFRPWNLETVIGFQYKSKAVAFERYLKSGSGFSFAKRHFFASPT
jgi:predicted GIY-YIG superfamily endonuclease